jgi:NodT family efflux transporter outer membrane factor (OMF) lipoprotein
MNPLHYIAGLALCPLLLCGCTLGPDYHGPAAVTPTALNSEFARGGADTRQAAPVATNWWHALADAQLDALIDTALADSPDLAAAQARVRQARAGLALQHSDGQPKVGASAAYVHAGSAADTPATELFLAGFDASWELDLFGGNRRAVEAVSAEAQATQNELADAQVQLAAEVALAYVSLRDQQQRVALARQSQALEDQTLSLTEQRRSGGTASQLDLERIQTQVDSTRASIIALDAQVAESLDQLALLCGQVPAALDSRLSQPRPLPTLPATVAIGDPAQLLRQRPDIRAAERRLASRTAQIGEQRAGAFPRVTLFGSLSFDASEPGHLLRKDSLGWLGVPYLQWNLLDFGRNAAKVNQAEAGRDEAQARYNATVLGALRDANVALSRYGHERQNAVALAQVEASATRAATLTQQRYRAGTSTALGWLDAERTRYSAQQNRVQSQAQLLKNYIALQKSLGLGWQPSTLR